MKTYIFRKKEYHLLFNANVYFAIEDKFENKTVIDLLNEKGETGLYNICWLMEKLSTQGELMRRYEGHEAQKPLKCGELMVIYKPFEIIEAKAALMDAVIDGYKQHEGEEEEIDLGLLELQKKTETING